MVSPIEYLKGRASIGAALFNCYIFDRSETSKPKKFNDSHIKFGKIQVNEALERNSAGLRGSSDIFQ